MQTDKSYKTIQGIIDSHEKSLKLDGVTKIHVGWVFVNKWITNERAIVVLTKTAADRDAVEAKLPKSMQGVKIQVRRDPRPPKKKKGPSLLELVQTIGFDERQLEPE